MARKAVGVFGSAAFIGFGIWAWAARPPAPNSAAHPQMKVAPAAQALHNQLEHATEAAAKKGEYTCCVSPACEFCASHIAKSPCGKNLAAAKAVCRECKGGWDAGEGRLAGIKPSNVKVMSTQQVLAMIQQGPQKMMHRTMQNMPKTSTHPKPKAKPMSKTP